VVVDATDHRQVTMNAVACTTVVVAVVLIAGRLSPHRRCRRLPVVTTDRSRRACPRRWPRRTPLVVALASASTIALTVGPTVAGAVAGAVGLALVRRRRRRAVARRRDIAAALPDAIEFLVLIVHAGLSPTQAVLEAAARAPVATRPGFAATAHRLQRGQVLGDALAALVDELGPAAAPVADGIAAAERYGLPLAPLLDNLSEQAHAARRRLAEAEARRLPVRLSFPLVVCTLPAFALLAIVPAVIGTISSLRGHPA
jgi:tight adherence protein C